MKNTSKVISFVMGLILIMVLVGCGNASNGESGSGEFQIDEDITMYVPFSVGGALDVRARVIATFLEEELGVNITVENPTGAGGVVGIAEFLNQGGPYDLMFSDVNTTLGLTPQVTDTPWSPDDLQPVISLDREQFGLFTNPEETNISSFEDLVEYGESNQIQFGSGGPGNITHLLQDALYTSLGLEAETIPHNGAQEGLTNALGGHNDVTLAGLKLAEQFVEDGRLTPILTFSENEYTDYEGVDPVPPVSSIANEGDFVYESLMAFSMKSSTEPEAVEAMYNAISNVYENPDAMAELENVNVEEITEMNAEEISNELEEKTAAMEAMLELTE
ncbi:tripartite tricarboxylate transporter substrate-binding protein [Lentibacillus sediminis]|uniref:tripartite tricarboxylate transporter substrate-binding protein n=1 Tax=Lentibacillus sediminis TaxID=1940529 RepID=UPI000C1B8BFA|nr:tripartite tricarboxylate transporter substrate-binding protein [Lentibacillus sediminis]